VATTEGVFVSDGDDGWRKVSLGGPPSNDVTALAVTGDGPDQRVAIGTFDRGAAIHSLGEFRSVPGLEVNETINTAAWQGRGASATLWLGTAKGLVRGGPGARLRRFGLADGLPSPVVRAVLVLPDDRLLVGTDEGPAMLDGDRVTPLAEATRKRGRRPLDSPMRATWALARGSDGTLWIGTNAGLYYGKDGRFRRAAVATGELTDDWVTAIALHEADVFVGTYSGGVMRLRREEGHDEGGVTSRLVSASLGGGYVNAAGLVVRDGQLYAATMDGLLVRSVGDDRTAWEIASRVSPGRDVTAVAAAGGELWVASRRGLALSAIGSGVAMGSTPDVTLR
jgi:ligand-binding sensor domain-containing protein